MLVVMAAAGAAPPSRAWAAHDKSAASSWRSGSGQWAAMSCWIGRAGFGHWLGVLFGGGFDWVAFLPWLYASGKCPAPPGLRQPSAPRAKPWSDCTLFIRPAQRESAHRLATICWSCGPWPLVRDFHFSVEVEAGSLLPRRPLP